MDESKGAGGSDTLPPGTILGRYEIRRLLGQGGMGAVYEAVHRDLKKRVAVKTLLPSLASNSEARQRFLREGEAASRISHPHVVDVTDVGSEGSVIFLVMEYLEGEDLSQLIEREGALPVERTADIMLPVAAAISVAHQMGVIHRDLKPENVFLSREGYSGVHPKVLDFGISKVLGDGQARALTHTAATMGTMYYLPPEQLRGARQADARSDQYGLGTILYECITGRLAFNDENFYVILKKIAEGDFRPPRELRPELPPRMEALILRAMRLDPFDRFDSVAELGAALLEFASDGARMNWTPFFSASAAGAAAAMEQRPEQRPPGRRSTPGTRILPQNAPGSSDGWGKKSGRAATTMRSATGERRAVSVNTSLTGGRSRIPLLALAGVLLAGGAAVAILRTAGSHDDETKTPSSKTIDPPATPEPASYRVEIATEPANAALEIDGEPTGSGKLNRVMPIDGAPHIIVARAAGYQDATVRFKDRAPARLLALVPLAPLPPPGADPRPGAREEGRGATRPAKPNRSGKTGKPGKAGNVPRSESTGKPGKPAKPAKPDQPSNPANPKSDPKGDPFPNDAPVIE
jgi:serine/threonine protein kinase